MREAIVSQFTFPQRDDVFELQVELRDSQPLIWRRLMVRQDTPLPLLHRILQVAMGWSDYHLHLFRVGDGAEFGDPELLADMNPIDYRLLSLNQIASQKGARFVYEYDFGDSWEHDVTLRARHRLDSTVRYPICIAGERACPPEDCGGTGGYEDMLAALADPKHPEHGSYRTWAKGFDPERFDLDGVNRRLARLPQGRRTQRR